jgi:hypothetical protein
LKAPVKPVIISERKIRVHLYNFAKIRTKALSLRRLL